MRRIPSLGIVAAIVLLAVVVGGGMGWWVSRDNDVQPPKGQTVPAETINTSENSGETQPQPTTAKSKTAASEPKTTEVTDASANTAGQLPSAGENQWQQSLDEILTTEGEPEQKADRLLRMLPHLTEEAQGEVSQHLVNFVTDDHYLPLAKMLTNTTTSGSVSGVLMTDLLNRNDGLKLPLLLAMARNESHPKHDEAKELLELYLQENHGSNWAEWETSVTNYIAQNGPEIDLNAGPEPAPEPDTP
jgi:hypothetical protein